MNEREEFEELAVVFGFRDVARRERDGEYVVFVLQRAWLRWKEVFSETQAEARRYRFITANVYRAQDMLNSLPFSSSMRECAEALNAEIDKALAGAPQTPLEHAARVEAAAMKLRQAVAFFDARGGLSRGALSEAIIEFDRAVKVRR